MTEKGTPHRKGKERRSVQKLHKLSKNKQHPGQEWGLFGEVNGISNPELAKTPPGRNRREGVPLGARARTN